MESSRHLNAKQRRARGAQPSEKYLKTAAEIASRNEPAQGSTVKRFDCIETSLDLFIKPC